MTDLATLQQRLREAETARHRLMVGEIEVTVSVGGYGATTYAQTDMKKLDAYISRLKYEISRITGERRRGPILMRF